MNPERWRQVKALCEQLLERPASERADGLARLCPDDAELRDEVTELLSLTTSADAESHARRGPAMLTSPPALSWSTAPDPWVGTLVGRYRILRLIGEGGMGAVYEATQDQPHRSVALKIIRPHLASAEVLRRFQREWEALGRLQHPGIARVYEAGTADTPLGPQPFIAMELIHGEPLTAYARARQMPVARRLDLVARACDAVQHAHERGLIHRDLKPANILVDRDGNPRVLDFGVARLVHDDGHPTMTRQTVVGQLVGTLAYMSPEQALGDGDDLDTRSDVYALGLILYELLAGRLPFTLTSNVQDAVRIIRDEDPTPLSAIDRTYRGDVNVIVAKALEKDRQRRYASAAALADDIRRYLGHQPIAARPASATYHLTRFARRHRALVGGVVAVVIALAVGTIVSTWLALRARDAQRVAVAAERVAAAQRDDATRERNRAIAADAESRRQRDQAVAEQLRADREAAIAAAVSDFLRRDLLAQAGASTQASTSTTPDPDLTVRAALDRAARRIGSSFAQQPAIESAVRQTIGDAYLDLGLFTQAREQLEQALVLRRRMGGGSEPPTLETLSSLGKVLVGQGRFADAAERYREVLTVLRRERSAEDPDTLAVMTDLATALQLQGRYADAAALLSTASRGLRRVNGIDHPNTMAAIANLGEEYRLEGKYPAAMAQFALASRQYERVLGPDHPSTWRAMNGLALTYTALGRGADAEPIYRNLLQREQRILGREHSDTLVTMNNLALTLTSLTRYHDAETLYEEALGIRRRVFGGDHPDTLLSMNNLGNVYLEDGRYADAEPLFDEALTGRRKRLGPEHPNTLNVMANLAQTYFREAKWDAAERLLTDVLDARRRVLGAENPSTSMAAYQMGVLYARVGRFDEAAAMLASARAAWTRSVGLDHGSIWRTDCQLGAVLLRRGAFAEAKAALAAAASGSARVLGPSHIDTLRCTIDLAAASRDGAGLPASESALTGALDHLRRQVGEQHPDTLAAESSLGDFYLRTGSAERAEPLLAHAARGRREILGASHPDTLQTSALLGWSYVSLHRFDDAAAVAASLAVDAETPTTRWYRQQGQAILGASRSGQDRLVDAEAMLVRSYEELRAAPPTISAIDREVLGRIADVLAFVYQSMGRVDRAGEWRARVRDGGSQR